MPWAMTCHAHLSLCSSIALFIDNILFDCIHAHCFISFDTSRPTVSQSNCDRAQSNCNALSQIVTSPSQIVMRSVNCDRARSDIPVKSVSRHLHSTFKHINKDEPENTTQYERWWENERMRTCVHEKHERIFARWRSGEKCMIKRVTVTVTMTVTQGGLNSNSDSNCIRDSTFQYPHNVRPRFDFSKVTDDIWIIDPMEVWMKGRG